MKILAVFGLGMTGLWQGVPAGFAFGLHPVVTGLAAGFGSLFSTILVLFLGDKLRERLLRRRPKKTEGESEAEAPRERLIDRIWRRYGVVGLGLLGPGLTGAPIGAALGVSLGVSGRRMLAWLALGILLWTASMTVIGVVGVAGILRLLGRA